MNSLLEPLLTSLIALVGLSLTWLAMEYWRLQKTIRTRTKIAPYLIGFMGGICIVVFSFFGAIFRHIKSLLDSNTNTSPLELAVTFGLGLGSFILVVALSHLFRSRRIALLNRQPGTTLRQLTLKGDLSSTFFHNSPALYLVIDKKQRIIDANKALADFLITTPEELGTKKLDDLVVNEDRILLKEITPAKIASSQNIDHLSLRLSHYENEPLWVKIRPAVINWGTKNEECCLLLLEDNREAKNLSELITFHSQYDELTMLHNRESLENYLAQVLDISKENKSQVALIYINVDQLKVVNDTCGHTAGDRLLQYLVTVLGDASSECNFFARMGGDEFAMVKVNCNEQEALAISERVRSAAEDFTFVWRNQNYRQSVSIGVALSSDTIVDVVDLVGAADSACYTAKLNGRNRVMVYSESIARSQDNRRDMLWVSRLQQAIQEGQFVLYFHPIHRLDAPLMAHVHYELLIRYVDDEGNHILPQHFLPAVERFGLSEQIDLWVLTTALDYLDKHPEHTNILDCCSINLTSQSIANPRIRSAILQVVNSYTFPMDRLCFEITESSAIHNLKEAQEFVDELKTLGCKLALDDFGTGFSSFGYLKHLNVDYIKIDGSFVRDIIDDRFDRAMVAAINNIGKEMNIEIIAEYAEKASILKTLKSMDVEYAQGNAIAKPLPLSKLEAYYSSKPQTR